MHVTVQAAVFCSCRGVHAGTVLSFGFSTWVERSAAPEVEAEFFRIRFGDLS